MPEYKHGGMAGLIKFIKDNMTQSPQADLEGMVVATFVIDTTGAVTNPKIVKSLSEWADQEVLRVVQLLEFTPSMQGNRKVNVTYTIPVRFTPAEEQKKRRKK